MSEFEPEQVAEDEQTSGAAEQPAAGAEHPGASADSGPHGPESAAESQPAAEAGSPVAAESPVAAALAEMNGLAERPVADHPDIYGRAHAQLQNALSAIDDA